MRLDRRCAEAGFCVGGRLPKTTFHLDKTSRSVIMKLTNAADERLATITRKVIVFSAKENGDYFFSEFMQARRIMITDIAFSRYLIKKNRANIILTMPLCKS